MNDQNTQGSANAEDTKKTEKAKAEREAEAKRKAAEVPDVVEDPSLEAEGGKELVQLVHPDGKSTVQVAKPSRDHTNYVRGYGYTEVEGGK